MGRRRNAALRDAAGVYHVASRLANEGFNATVARGPDGGTDVLAGLHGSSVTAALMVRTTECPPGFGVGDKGKADVCEWSVGKASLADDPGLFVALVDLKRDNEQSRVWVVPSGKIGGHSVFPNEPQPYRYRPPAEELAPYKEDWDAIEDHLLRGRARRTGWFERQELVERYGEGFVEALDTEASRLLEVEKSTIRRMADDRFSAEDLAEASALLSVLFRRWMEHKRGRGGG